MNRICRQTGFTLIEMVVVLGILVLLAGLIAPYLAVSVRVERNEATMNHMEELEEALNNYGRDHFVYPTTLDDLLSNVSETAAWRGPYTVHRFSSTGGSSSGDARQDAWSENYVYTRLTTTTARLRSMGDDRSAGTEDDIVKDLDLTALLREETMRREKVLNDAIAAYNAVHLPGNPLPNSSFADLRDELIDQNYLQDIAWHATDAWGDPFEIVDRTNPPPMRVYSINGGTSSNGSSENNGGGQNNGRGNGRGRNQNPGTPRGPR